MKSFSYCAIREAPVRWQDPSLWWITDPRGFRGRKPGLSSFPLLLLRVSSSQEVIFLSLGLRPRNKPFRRFSFPLPLTCMRILCPAVCRCKCSTASLKWKQREVKMNSLTPFTWLSSWRRNTQSITRLCARFPWTSQTLEQIFISSTKWADTTLSGGPQ